MSDLFPACPECGSEYTYETGALLTCPMCGYEWSSHSGSDMHRGSDTGSDTDSDSDTYMDADAEAAGDPDAYGIGEAPESLDAGPAIRDAVGNVLEDGDTVAIAKDVKVKGAGGGTLKIGTKVRGIRLAPGGPNGHDIDAKVPGFGQMMLKSSVVKKVT